MQRDADGDPIGLFSPSRSIASRVRGAAWRDFFGGDLNAANASGFSQAEAQRASYAVEAGYFHILNAPDDDDYGVFFMVPQPVINVIRARRDDSATFVVGVGPASLTPIPPGLPEAGTDAYFAGGNRDERANYYLSGEDAPDPDGSIGEVTEIYAGSIINMRTGQVIPSRQLGGGAIVLGQEGARVGINGSNARVPLPIVDTVEDIVTLTMRTTPPSMPQGILATIDPTARDFDTGSLEEDGNSEPLRDVCKVWIFPELEDAETDLQSLYDDQVSLAFEDLVKRWAGPAADQIPMENLARMVNAADPPLTLVINLERDVNVGGVPLASGAPVDFDFVINREIQRDGNNFNADNVYSLFRFYPDGRPALPLPRSGPVTISVLTGQTAVTLLHRRLPTRFNNANEPDPPVDIIYTLTQGSMGLSMLHMVDTVTIGRTVRRQDHDAGVDAVDTPRRLVTPYVFTVRIDRRPRGLLVVGGDLTGYRLSEWAEESNRFANPVFRDNNGRALYIPYLNENSFADPPSARMTIRYVSDQPTFGNRQLNFRLGFHCSLGNLSHPDLVRIFDRTGGTDSRVNISLGLVPGQGASCPDPGPGHGAATVTRAFLLQTISIAPRIARDSAQFENNVIVVDDEDFYGTGRVTVTLYTVAEFVVQNNYFDPHLFDPSDFYPPVLRFGRACAGTENADGQCANTAADNYLRDVNGGLNFFANVSRHGGSLSEIDRARTGYDDRFSAIVYRNLSVEICPFESQGMCDFGSSRAPFFVTEDAPDRGSARFEPPENTCDFLIPNADGSDRIISVPALADGTCPPPPIPDQFFNAAEVLADDSAVSGEDHGPTDGFGVTIRVADDVTVNFPLTGPFTVARPYRNSTVHVINPGGGTDIHSLAVSLYANYGAGESCPLRDPVPFRNPDGVGANFDRQIFDTGSRCGLMFQPLPGLNWHVLQIPVTASAFAIKSGIEVGGDAVLSIN